MRECLNCAAPMKEPKPSHIGEGKYCSVLCKAEFAKKTGLFAGPRNGRYIDGLGTVRANRQWRTRHPDKVAHNNRATKAARKGARGSHTRADIDALWIRQDGKCAACSACMENNGCHVDHIIPIARGGTHFIGNIQLLCAQCNLRKRVALPIAFRVRHLLRTNEDREQASLFEWADGHASTVRELGLLIHFANGGYRHKAVAAKLALLGVKRGVPDLLLPVPRSGKSALFIELKAGKNKATPEQAAWIDVLNRAGNLALVCNGWIEAARAIATYLGLPEGVAP